MSEGRRLDEILASAAADEPTGEQLERLEARLAALLVPPGGGGPGGGGGGPGGAARGGAHPGGGAAAAGAAAKAAKAAKGGAALKWLMAAVIGGGAAGGAVAVHHLVTSTPASSRRSPARAVMSAPAPAQSLAQTAALADAGPGLPDAGPPADAASAGAQPSGAERPRHHRDGAQALAAETRLLDRAQSALRRGAAGTALSLCERHARRFPRGTLREERERIAIEALLDLGRPSQARARARAFESQFPDSVQLPRIHALLGRHR